MKEMPGSDCFGKPAAENPALIRAFEGKEDLLASIPSIPAVMHSLLGELDQPADSVNLLRVAEIMGHDETLAAQCLRMANSVLFSRGPAMDSLRGAVRTLGIARIRDIAVSCGLMRVMPASLQGLDPMVFWKHSLACAIISRKLARAVGFGDPEKAYLAGLLHDLGYIVNLSVFPEQSRAALKKAETEGRYVGEVECAELGFTHCQSGELLARRWKLADVLVEVILYHHNPGMSVVNPALVAIVSLADRLCRASNLGLGYVEASNPMEDWESAWKLLSEHCPLAAEITWQAFVGEHEAYTEEIHKLVAAMYKGK